MNKSRQSIMLWYGVILPFVAGALIGGYGNLLINKKGL